MTERVEWVPEGTWETIVKHVPIPSVDLVVKFEEGVLLAKRQNEPAKGEWFVPGGRIQKGESLREAVHRVAQQELNVAVEIRESLGAYDHCYETAEEDNVGGKHYVAHGFVVTPESESTSLDDQHSAARVFEIANLPPLHENVEAYIDNSELIESWR